MKTRRKKKIKSRRKRIERLVKKIPPTLRQTAAGLKKVSFEYQKVSREIGRRGEGLLEGLSDPQRTMSVGLLGSLMGEIRPQEWNIVEDRDAYKSLQGCYVKTYPDEQLIKATPRLLVKGQILRDAVGGPMIFDKKGKIVGRGQVSHDGKLAYALFWRGKLISFRG